jgi:hypothetical protein
MPTNPARMTNTASCAHGMDKHCDALPVHGFAEADPEDQAQPDPEHGSQDRDGDEASAPIQARDFRPCIESRPRSRLEMRETDRRPGNLHRRKTP